MEQQIVQGDSAVVLRDYPDNSFDVMVVDPPHALGFMGADWDAALPAQPIWDECFRVLKPGGHVWMMSSERWGCIFGFGLGLKRAGFEIEEHQLLMWVSLTGMPKSNNLSKTADKEVFRAWLALHREAVACPDHREPKDPEGKLTRCVECERIFAEGGLTRHDQRKAESAAVGGAYSGLVPENRKGRVTSGVAHAHVERDFEQALGKPDELLPCLLTLHWPTSPAEQRAEWGAVVETPEGWDCGKPPGVRVALGVKHQQYPNGPGGVGFHGGPGEYTQTDRTVPEQATAPSTPDACEWEGWKGSCAVLKPFAYPIIHAVKPREGNYLNNARRWGVGAFNIKAAKIPFGEGEPRDYGIDGDEGQPHVGVYQENRERVAYNPSEAGRDPANLLSYGDLLGKLTKYTNLDAWCERLGLPTASAELLEAGLVYCTKPNKTEKSQGLPEDYDAERNPCAKPVALCAYLISLSTREGQRVLDPFCGEAPVGVAAARLGRGYVGIDTEEDFCQTARLRIAVEVGDETVEKALDLNDVFGG